jgi:hypothetical protein
MKSRLVYLVLAALGLGGLGWYAYTNQKNPGSFGFELKGSAPAADGASATAKGGDGAKAGPDGKPPAGGPPAGGPGAAGHRQSRRLDGLA